ncbi:MAG: carbon-nitrogen hydrolase family protein [Melioribacteraceae bacterium]|nr:carbon-nitrogen hydrolase family protein [Melioribacteraceae bacterium]MCF8265037.1 carbon-nitrogen hydrolase family protein [Melioribacteraceae bacterium]MCF8431651.1 carbon-nitrogen hydrolase family protein [Melioribacteraceae bacterium]
MKVSIAQISPVWLNKTETLNKVNDYISEAGKQNCKLIAFSEAFVPGYPFWTERTGGAEFNSSKQKELFAYYLRQSVCIEKNDLVQVSQAAKENQIAVILGIIERPLDRGGHSLYASRVYFDKTGEILSVHRKLMPTYDERLTWSIGDGHGLQVHTLNEFTVGALNCWENWMPLVRSSLYALGENLHVAIWPGSIHNTKDITRFIALESRSFVISASSVFKKEMINSDIPYSDEIIKNSNEYLANGGSCIAGPDGNWIVEPIINEEKLITAELDIQKVFEERQNFDAAGHYSRPDVTKLSVNRKRQSTIELIE